MLTNTNESSTQAGTEAAVKEVKQVLTDVYVAWAANDADAFVASFTEDAVSTLPGSYRGDRSEIRHHMAVGFEGVLKGSTVVDEVRDVRFPAPDTAVVTARGAILFAGETEVPDSRYILATWTLVRRDGRWLAASYHNCPEIAPGR
ncbi:SgcJ/EcaC family oxidoreductase [Yinghuangia seranimata]|uniref:SgcJ/EcaC family oxidoreductase n=1 Tax=Yinghuangia seranimata TaxID=408067 RepID=UPI00248B2C35|nr:SgcJ/EcaC family oxidoreductase [Yinghuangia seranimata]MDI2131393.1 SgcJ/EcaC family oxidoreductase [Yinghuangia seranimata]